METVKSVALLTIGLILGGVITHQVSSSTVNILNTRIEALEKEAASVEDYRTRLVELEMNHSSLLEDYNRLVNQSELYNSSDFRVEKTRVLVSGSQGMAEETIEFDVGYGIVMEVYVNLVSSNISGSNIDIDLSWGRGDQRGFLVGLGNAPAQASTNVTCLSFCEIYDESDDKIWVKVGARIGEYPWIEKESMMVFSKYKVQFDSRE